MSKNYQFRLAQRPVGMPQKTDWSYTSEDIPALQEGEFLIKTEYISLDPAMRGWMNDAKSYIPPVGINEVMRAGTAGKVIESKNPNFQVGDAVAGAWGVQQYAVSNGKGVQKVDTSLAPLPMYIGTLGTTGLTAYFGLLDLGQPKEGETVVVSGAAGAVGMIVGQIAKIKGCRVVGIAGGQDKCDFVVNELGFDACIDYKAGEIRKGLKEHCPNGVDVYFDNVGGDILDLTLLHINKKARIVICGAISQYNNTTPMKGPSNYMQLLVKGARMEGFVVFDFIKDYGKGVADMIQWYKAGKLKSREHIVKGFDTFPETMLMLFEGKNTGKLVLEV
jgi:NADPH-dependent curcumin reductase CurA